MKLHFILSTIRFLASAACTLSVYYDIQEIGNHVSQQSSIPTSRCI